MSGADSRRRPAVSEKGTADLPTRVHRGRLIVLQVVMALALVPVFCEGRWADVFLVMAITVNPGSLARQFRVRIRPEYQVLAVIFELAALLFGEIRGYCERIVGGALPNVPVPDC